MAQRPNIVFFMMDQLSAKWLEGEAAQVVPTPNIDRLRRHGTSFQQAFTSNPVCCPARATLATGLTTRGHGVLQNGYELDPALPTFMRALQREGWRTGAFGKVHFHVHYHGVHPDYHPYGFEVVHNTEDPRAGEWLDWVAEAHPAHYKAALATIWATEIPELKAYGEEQVDLSARIREIRRDFEWATPEHPDNTAGTYTLPFPEEVSQTAWITQHALDFIDQTDEDQPLYAHISYVQPHSPFCPPAAYMDRVNAEAIPAPVPPEWVNDPHRPTCFEDSEGSRTVIPDNWRAYRHYYFADLAHLDRQLGLVIERLQATGRWDNTYLILLSDHGELLLDHGFTGKAERHYDAGVRVPLIIAGPGIEHGQSVEAIVQLEDVFPTVMEMVGLPQPRLPIGGVHLKTAPLAPAGRSLMPWCRGETPQAWRDTAYIESYNNIYDTSPDCWARTVRTAEWRYTLYPGGAGEQLFSLLEDPDETINLVGECGYETIRSEMRDRLLESVILQDHPHTPRSLYALGVH
jgi:arylsulfatase A-like enzyme